MTTIPFELTIRRLGRQGGTETVLCRRSLRAIANNREVFDSEWKGKGVIVKVFSRNLVSRIRFKREWGGLLELGRRGINAPKLLFYGRTENPASPKGYAEASWKWAVVMEKIGGSQTLAEIFSKAKGERRVELLMMACREMAHQHEKGILQEDVHLGNFLWDGDKIFSIDPAQMRFFPRPIGRKKSIFQLALLTCYFHGDEASDARNVWREYFNLRKWRFGESDERLLWEQTAAHKRNWIRGMLKKCLRTSKKYLRISKDGNIAVFDREFIAGAEPIDFLNRIEELMEKGEILKRGNTSCVSRLTFNGRDIVIKRYNYKGIFHSLRHTIKGSRAKQGWLYGHRLLWLGVRTPKPLAYIEHRKGPILWKSYLVTQYVDGQNMHYFLQDKTVSEEKRSTIVRQILELLERIHKNGLTHRDLKPSNILVTAEGPVLTDLDAMKAHKLGWICVLKGRGYLERFKKSVNEGPV